MKKFSAVLLILMLLSIVLTACNKATPATTTTSSPKPTTQAGSSTTTTTGTTKPATSTATASVPQGTLNVAVSTLGNENWLPNLGDGSSNSFNLAYEMLLYKKPGSDQLIPGLAESWTTSPDGTTWTFNLKKGVQFQEGWGELTADDVKYTYDLLVSQGSTSGAKNFLSSTVKSVEVVNPYQIVFHTSPTWALGYWLTYTPTSYFLVVSKKYVESVGQQKANAHPVGTSPWHFIEAVHGDHVTYEAVPNHWRQTPYYKTLTLKVVPEQSTVMAMLQTGQLDLAPIDISSVSQAQKAGLLLHSVDNTVSYQVYIGGLLLPNDPAYSPNLPWVGPDPAKALMVRQALAMAVDRQSIINSLLNGQGKQISVPHYFNDMPQNDPALKPYPYDPAAAKKLLADAGYPKGFDITLGALRTPSATMVDIMTQAVVQDWQKIGLNAKVQPLEYATFKPDAVARKNNLSIVYGGPRWVEPIQLETVLWGSKASPLYGPEDPTGKLDSLMSAASAEIDYNKRAQIQQQIEHYFYDQYWGIPIASVAQVFASTKKVGTWPMLVMTYPLNLEYITP